MENVKIEIFVHIKIAIQSADATYSNGGYDKIMLYENDKNPAECDIIPETKTWQDENGITWSYEAGVNVVPRMVIS